MLLTDSQTAILKKHGIEIVGNLKELLISIDDLIIEIGFDESDDFLNDTGLELQRLYDEINAQNS